MSGRVLMLHGIWNTRSWMLPLVWRLRRAGIDAHSFGYDSILGGPRAAVPALAASIQAQAVTGLVGYSLGGLIALQALQQHPGLPVTTLVCLGTPLSGSQTARQLCQLRLGRLLGRSGQLLGQAQQRGTGAVRIGQVAGNRPLGLGRLLGAQGRDSDGTVGLAETHWPGLADHCVVPATHTGLPFNRQAAGQVVHFLRNGCFVPGVAPG